MRDSQRVPVSNVDYNIHSCTGLWLRLSRGQKEFLLFFFFLRIQFCSSSLKGNNQAVIVNSHRLIWPSLVKGQSSNGETSKFLSITEYWAIVNLTPSALKDPCQFTNNANQQIIQKSLLSASRYQSRYM